jgi:hypothetical protein
MVKGWGTAGIRSEIFEEVEDELYSDGYYSIEPILAPIARVDGFRLAKRIGAKADKSILKWRHAVKLCQKMWPHGYKGRKPHKEDFTADTNICEDFNEDTTPPATIFTDSEDVEDDTTPPVDTYEDDMHYFNDTLPSAYIGLSEDFPALCTTTPASIKSRASQWCAARDAALHPLRVAKRLANDASEVEAAVLESYTRAANAARNAEAEWVYRYRKRFYSRPIYYWATWQYARKMAFEAVKFADCWANTLLRARANADKARQKVKDLENT